MNLIAFLQWSKFGDVKKPHKKDYKIENKKAKSYPGYWRKSLKKDYKIENKKAKSYPGYWCSIDINNCFSLGFERWR